MKSISTAINVRTGNELILVSDSEERNFNVAKKNLGVSEDMHEQDLTKAEYLFPNMVSEGKARKKFYDILRYKIEGIN